MLAQRLWYYAACAAAACAVAIAGCSGSGSSSTASGSAGSAGSSAGSSTSRAPSTAAAASGTRPAVSQGSARILPSAAGAARKAAETVQGAAAVPTAAELTALRAQAGEIARLTPRQMAGQRVIYSYNGLTAPPGLIALIRHGDVGGVIFFSFNISSEAQIRGVIKQMIAANLSPQNPARNYPLLLMTDQEGGEVRRLPGAPLESQAQIGASAAPAAQAAAAGAAAAANLRGVVMNLNLAPVLDVYRQAGNFDDQFHRSYSMNPQVVAEAGAAFVRAQQSGHVAATVKHFPGLGAASTLADTDHQPVTINLSAHTLRTVDELPYRAAFKAGAQVTMVSWAIYPALDRRLPAALSPTIVQGELRHRLGFTGVTITDALGAGALRSYGSLQNKSMLAARAGMDALLCTAIKPLPGWKCLAGLERGYQTGALPRQAFEAQLAQLLQLRAGLLS